MAGLTTSSRAEAARRSRQRISRLKPLRSKRGFWLERGYIRVPHPERPGRWLYQHRVVAEQMLDRMLSPDEHVHHINGIKTDNHPENLQILSNTAHHAVERGRIQGILPLNAGVLCLCGCGELVPEFDKRGRRRQGYVLGHNGSKRGACQP